MEMREEAERHRPTQATDASVPMTNNDVKQPLPTQNTSTNNEPLPTLEDEVKQLVGNVSSWWSGFSKRSQDQIKEVRAQIDAQGGIVSMAKREAQKLEEQLNEAQKAARQEAQTTGEDQTIESSTLNMDGWGTVGSIGAPPPASQNLLRQADGSNKGKAKEREGDDGAAVEQLEERIREKRERGTDGQRTESASLSTAGGEALFDAENDLEGNEQAGEGVTPLPSRPSNEFKVIDDAIAVTQRNAQSAMNSMQSFWKQLQADPRLTNMQASVAQSLQNMSLVTPGTEGSQEKGASDGAAQPTMSPRARASLALPDLSKKFQDSFPHLDLKESQTMARRYLEASQNAARDWGKEMGHLVSDLVHIVPPENPADAGVGSNRSATTSSGMTGSSSAFTSGESQPRGSSGDFAAQPLQAAANEEDDFDWDNDVDGTSSGGLETTTGPPTTSWEGSTSDTNLASHVQTISEAEEGSATLPESTTSNVQNNAAIAKGAHGEKRDDEDDDDSDWE